MRQVGRDAGIRPVQHSSGAAARCVMVDYGKTERLLLGGGVGLLRREALQRRVAREVAAGAAGRRRHACRFQRATAARGETCARPGTTPWAKRRPGRRFI